VPKTKSASLFAIGFMTSSIFDTLCCPSESKVTKISIFGLSLANEIPVCKAAPCPKFDG
jgi:hypothetical protein